MQYEKKIKINNMINKVKDKEIFKKIFFLVHNELYTENDCKYTHNNNGIFFDLNLLSDETLLKIEETILDSNTLDNNTDSESIKLSIYSNEETDYMKISDGFKLSNKEKTLINCIQK